MFLQAISLYLLTVVAHAERHKWYVAHGAPYTNRCGRSRETACSQLKDAIGRAGFDGDTVFIEPSDNIYELCTRRPSRIYKNISLVGDGGLVTIGCNNWMRKGGHIIHYGKSVLKHSLHLHNLTLVDGQVSVPDEFHADNVFFSESVLTNNATDCRELDVTIHNSNWTETPTCNTQTAVCTGKTSVISCDYLTVNISNNHFESSSITLKATRLLTASVSDSTFRGPTPGNATSLQIRISGGGKISLKKTSFEHYHSQTLVGYALNLYQSALLIHTERYSNRDVTVHMEDMTFRDNERGLTLIGKYGDVSISRSTFSDNKVMHSGAAILSLATKETPIRVSNCRFDDNVAGSFPRNFSVHLPHDVAEVVHGRAILNAPSGKGVMDRVGRGGAIRVQRGHMTITDSSFSGNDANLQGGSIMVDQGSTLKLENTRLYTSHGRTLMGAILFSRGQVELNNVQMAAKAIRKRSSLLEHSGDHWSIRIRNIYAECPAGHNLHVEQTSAFAIGLKGMRMAPDRFDHVQYECEACPRGLYSLDHGFLNDTTTSDQDTFYKIRLYGNDTNSAGMAGHHTHHFVHCQACPHGHGHDDRHDHRDDHLADGASRDDHPHDHDYHREGHSHDDDHHDDKHHDDDHNGDEHHGDEHHDDDHHGDEHHGDEHHDDEHHGDEHHDDEHHDDEHHDDEHHGDEHHDDDHHDDDHHGDDHHDDDHHDDDHHDDDDHNGDDNHNDHHDDDHHDDDEHHQSHDDPYGGQCPSISHHEFASGATNERASNVYTFSGAVLFILLTLFV